MKARTLISVLFAAVLLLGDAAPVAGQTTEDVPDAHHTPEAQADGAAPAAEPGDASAAEAQNGMAGMMQMMTPEMMEMMMRMMQQMTMAAGGPGMTGLSPMQMAGGSGMCPSMMPMMQGAVVGSGMPGMLGAGAMLLGAMGPAPEEMTAERVRSFLERELGAYGNTRLTLGQIATAEDGSIVAEIVTVDGSLVQKLAFNRYPGLFRQIPWPSQDAAPRERGSSKSRAERAAIHLIGLRTSVIANLADGERISAKLRELGRLCWKR